MKCELPNFCVDDIAPMWERAPLEILSLIMSYVSPVQIDVISREIDTNIGDACCFDNSIVYRDVNGMVLAQPDRTLHYDKSSACKKPLCYHVGFGYMLFTTGSGIRIYEGTTSFRDVRIVPDNPISILPEGVKFNTTFLKLGRHLTYDVLVPDDPVAVIRHVLFTQKLGDGTINIATSRDGISLQYLEGRRACRYDIPSQDEHGRKSLPTVISAWPYLTVSDSRLLTVYKITGSAYTYR